MLPTRAYGAQSVGSPLAPMTIERRPPGAEDILLDVLYCGICHSDVSYVSGYVPQARFPVVPGHEIVGRVTQVGSAVTRHRVGDVVGVGYIYDSCRRCSECHCDHEQYCNALVSSFFGVEHDGKTFIYGGYSDRITVNQHYVLKIPAALSPAAAAPLLCAGITTYSPLRHANVGPGSEVAIIGLGGLGHLGVKLAKAMGARVTVLSRSQDKKSDALALGADDYVSTRDPDAFSRLAARFDLILNTVSGDIDWDSTISTLKRDGALVLLGGPDSPVTFIAPGVMFKRRIVTGSIIGGLRQTQEMLDFCAHHGIAADIEIIGIDQVNKAYERLAKSDVRYRFVIDMASLNR